MAWFWLSLGLGVYLVGLALGRVDDEGYHRSSVWARLFSSASLILASFSWWWVRRDTPLASYTAFLCAGMTLSFVGDLCMSHVLPLRQHVIWGMLAFGVAHVLYITAFVLVGRMLGLLDWWAWGAGVGAGLALALLGWWTLVRGPAAGPVLNYGALGYALLLATMNGCAVGLAVQDGRFALLAGGAVLFLLSDFVLGRRLLRQRGWFLIGEVIWALYIAGQALIVSSSVSL